ncbi:MAG: hypothetical protein QXU18_04075 [Thermoplasmatales archaeon]
MAEEMIAKTIYLYTKHEEYLKKHQEINLSGLVRKTIDELIAKENNPT